MTFQEKVEYIRDLFGEPGVTDASTDPTPTDPNAFISKLQLQTDIDNASDQLTRVFSDDMNVKTYKVAQLSGGANTNIFGSSSLWKPYTLPSDFMTVVSAADETATADYAPIVMFDETEAAFEASLRTGFGLNVGTIYDGSLYVTPTTITDIVLLYIKTPTRYSIADQPNEVSSDVHPEFHHMISMYAAYLALERREKMDQGETELMQALKQIALDELATARENWKLNSGLAAGAFGARRVTRSGKGASRFATD
jgi:hypothetical protein